MVNLRKDSYYIYCLNNNIEFEYAKPYYEKYENLVNTLREKMKKNQQNFITMVHNNKAYKKWLQDEKNENEKLLKEIETIKKHNEKLMKELKILKSNNEKLMKDLGKCLPSAPPLYETLDFKLLKNDKN